MEEQFFSFRTTNLPESWMLQIVCDANGDMSRYDWCDLTWARRLDLTPPLEIAVIKRGIRRDVSFDLSDVPVVSSRAAEQLRRLANGEIELIPARVHDQTDEFFVLNILSSVKCVDEEKTEYVEKWTADSYRPDRAGEYKVLRGIIVDPVRAMGHNMFRIWGSYATNIIVSSKIKETFEREQFSGARFEDVSPRNPSP